MKKIVSDVLISIFLSILGIVLVTLFVVSILQLVEYPALADAWVAIGTLALAFVTFVLVGLTWWNIQLNSKKENRDRKEQYIRETIDWAMGILRMSSDLWSVTGYREQGIILAKRRSIELTSNAQALRDKGKYITKISTIVERTVGSKTGKLLDELTEITRMLDDVCLLENLDEGVSLQKTSEDGTVIRIDIDMAWKIVEKHRSELAPLYNSVIDKSSEANLKLLSK